MKIAVLLSEHLLYFSGLDPFNFLERGDFPDRICVGAVETNEKSGYDEPVGLMILHLQVDYVSVEWIFVDGQHRMRGIGSALMEHAFNLAANLGFDKLRLYLNEMPDRTLFCPYEADFIKEYSFVPVSLLPGEWSTDVEALMDHPAIGHKAHKNKKTVAVSELNEEQKKKLMEFVQSENSSCFLYNKNYVVELSDRNISRVLLRKDEIKGTIFLQSNGENIYVTGLSCKNREDELSLCHGALMAAGESDGESRGIHVLEYDNIYSGTLKGLFGDEPIRNSIYEASVTDYFEKLNSFVPIEELGSGSCIFQRESVE